MYLRYIFSRYSRSLVVNMQQIRAFIKVQHFEFLNCIKINRYNIYSRLLYYRLFYLSLASILASVYVKRTPPRKSGSSKHRTDQTPCAILHDVVCVCGVCGARMPTNRLTNRDFKGVNHNSRISTLSRNRQTKSHKTVALIGSLTHLTARRSDDDLPATKTNLTHRALKY